MGQERNITGNKVVLAGFMVLFFAILNPVLVIAQTSVVINEPTTYERNQPFQMRTPTRPHRGHDYLVPCGTTIQTQAPVQCMTAGGYGSLAEASHGCGVVTRYAHLNSCVAGQSSVVSGGARGSEGAGNSEGCHLHYELRINGTAVNPASAFGQNLCDPATQQRLIEEAQSILNGQAGGGGGTTPNPNNPTGGTPGGTTGGNNVQSVTYVPGGTLTNPGRGYYEIVTTDGRVIREIDLSGTDPGAAPLPPTNTDVVVPGGAGTGEVTGCATDTWTAMVNQSVLQTRREMLFNERYIAKPDSVMAYSCLSEQLLLAGQEIGPIFSESQLWVNKDVDILNGETVTVNVDMGTSSLDGAIVNVATEPYEGYLMSMFNHDFLGGTAAIEDAGGGGHEDHSHSTSQEHTPCGIMAEVWQMAKCMDATDDPLFFRFEELIDFDPRAYPENYACNNTGITQGMIDIARGAEVLFDPVMPRMEMILPIAGCYPAIATGITVERQEGAGQISTRVTSPDGVCITSGCRYVGGACVP